MDRLLILACSQRKNPTIGVLPAIHRYDGPAFRVLRKFLRESREDVPVILILSAKYGLIDSAREISDYDCRISADLANRLRPAVLECLGQVLQSRRWHSIGICVGKEYGAALAGMKSLLPYEVQVELLGTGLGRRLTSLRQWLRREGPFGDKVGSVLRGGGDED
jgi:hypothetical protein